jgi:hypothetical protein
MGDIVTQQQMSVESSKVKSCDNLAKGAHDDERSSEKQEQSKGEEIFFVVVLCCRL